VIFTKLAVGEGVLGPPPRAKFHYSGFKNVGLSTPKSSKYGFFDKFVHKGPIPLSIFTKFGFGEGLPGSQPHGNFWYKMCPKGVYPLKRFLPHLAWGRQS